NEIKKRQEDTNNNGLYQNAYSFPFGYDVANFFSNNSIDANSDISSGSASSPDTTDLTLSPTSELAPYHIELSLECPFTSCQIKDKSKVKITDSTYLIEHLKEEHSIRFVNLHHVYLTIEKYLGFWAKQLDQDIIKQLDAEVNEDKNIREELQRDKLNEVLQIQANERNGDSKLQKKCLFCNNICENRRILFRHMFDEHNFNIGLPDNLVNVSEFLQILEDKLNRKHMRKKKHFKISARNRIYDQFYVINHLEPGKNWETFENERYESDEDYHNRDDPWDDWNEEESLPTSCLFCENISPSTKDIENHMTNTHGFNLLAIKRSMG
ncbi:2585_t:CDS:2, partial [Dentiscutata erythropus]